MRGTILAVVLVSCCLASCAPKEADLAGLKKAISEYNAASKSSMMGGDMEKTISFFADDGMEMPPNMPAVGGRDSIRAMWSKMMSSGMKMTAVEFTPLDIQAGGTVGYEIGNYAMTMSMPSMGEMKDQGKYMTVWRQQADGTWKLRAETWSSDMPMPSMEKPMPKKK
jgi:ketosteroid isomerase-like protein